ncbi:hypothetical protein SAMN05421841_0850 [Chryseobacterium wanjuense]|uniref:Uncharacterized protein n=1 Tax=Chryseobacterium wanjuense TaxID=356305 RepID=A0A1I0NWK4_9FLAO|nr:hypothetical protein [Chryseobacterium wanjuense]SEW06227.1 hypothetical protein SAMN05421841_0850 [Chryseobacterium wanjuense]
MKLESLKSSKFEAMSNEKMGMIKGGFISATNSRDVNTGAPVPDRQEITEVKNIHGVVTGYIYGCTEYQINGVWLSPIAH